MIVGGSVTGCFVGVVVGTAVVGSMVLGASVGTALSICVGVFEGMAVGIKVEGADVGAPVGAAVGDDEGDSEAVTVGLRVGSSVLTHRPPRPCSMKHVLSLEQQGMMASPSSSSSHLSPAATHVVGSNDGEADGMCEGEILTVGPELGTFDGSDEGDALGLLEGSNGDAGGDSDSVTVGLSVGSFAAMHRPPSPCIMKHMFLLEQQGTIGAPSLLSSHIPPGATHGIESSIGC